MIVIDSRKLRFLRAGRVLRVEVPREYRKGRDYAAGVRRNRTVCRVYVLSCTPEADAFVLEIRHHADAGERYLARNPGAQRRDYVLRPQEALSGEGAVIDAATLARYAREAYKRDDAIRRDRALDKRQNRSKRRYAP
jgi:hypothetical protein